MAGRRMGQKKRSARKRSMAPRAIPTESVTAPNDGKPVRGVKLRTVSMLTMLFALACLAAFMAGRPPASAANVEQRGLIAPEAAGMTLRHDDARSLLRRRGGGKRKPRAQKLEKSP
jgi:hypothetical protein